MFNINAAALPTLRTRQALLILDLQNEFVSPDGALTINQPDVIVSRVVRLANAFRLSGAGDVIWVRTQFDGHRQLSGGVDGGDQIITTDAPVAPKRTASSRGRPPASSRHDEAVMEADVEAFLSYPPGSEKPQCVSAGSKGAQLAAEVQQAVDVSRDIQFTKTHYSAFAAGQQLVQLLRGRFVTEIYVCGALTNIGIYATALDAGRHGYDITLVDDCCGYRSDMRHSNAVHRLMQLTGCEVTTSGNIMAKLEPQKPSAEEKAKLRSQLREEAGDKSSRPPRSEAVGRSENRSEKPAVGQPSAEDEDDPLPSSFEKLTLSGSRSPASEVPPATRADPGPYRDNTSPTTQQQVSPVVEGSSNAIETLKATTPVAKMQATHQIQYVDAAPLEVDPDMATDATPPGSESSNQKEQFDIEQALEFVRRKQRRGPHGSLNKPRSAPESATTAAAAKAKVRSRRPPESKTTSSEPSAVTVSADTEPTQPQIDSHAQSPPPSGPIASEPLCEGDTTIITNLLPAPLAATAFDRLKSEVSWQRMSHQGGEVPRLVAVQGEVDAEGNMPAYRHPSDESPPLLPFTPTVAEIKAHVEKQVGHPLNHVLIQCYRSGSDYISEHSDKTLDIVRGSFIANVSLGAERTMVFRTKRADKDPSSSREETSTTPAAATSPTPVPVDTSDSPSPPAPTTDSSTPDHQTFIPGPARRTVRAPLPHNSLCRMGLETNMRWLHSIRQDKRLDRDKTGAELAFSGERISLTFRRIGTFLDATRSHIWGQGAATSKSAPLSGVGAGAGAVINGQTPQAVAMLRAFGAENHSSKFDWEAWYGGGFDVLDISASPRLYYSRDAVVNGRVIFMLAHFGVGFAKGSMGGGGGGAGGPGGGAGGEAAIRFVDNDPGRTTVEGGVAVMLYLDGVYGQDKGGAEMKTREDLARRCTRFQAALGLGGRWRELADDDEKEDGGGGREAGTTKALEKELEVWEGFAREEARDERFIAGGSITIADFALWPVLHDIAVKRPGLLQRYKDLMRYYERLKRSKAGVKVVGGRSAGDEAAASSQATDE